MRRVRHGAACCLAFGLLACAAAAQEPTTALAPAPEPQAAAPATLALTLRQALERARESSLAVGRAQAELQAARALKKAALSLVLPKLSASGSLVRNSDEVTFGSDEDQRTILPRDDWGFRLTLQQPLFAGLREKRAYDQSKLGIDSAEDGLRGTREDVLLRVAADYLIGVEAAALAAVESRNVELASRRRKQAEDFYTAGETTRVDVLRAETATKEAQRRLVAARLAEQTAIGRLRVSLALDDVALQLQAPQADLAPLPEEAALVERAGGARPDLRQARTSLAVARLEVQKQRGAYLPVLAADAGYVRQKTTFPLDEYAYAALRVNVPLFQGGEIGARVAVARERERQAALALEDLGRQVREEVHTALLDVEAARTNLALAEEQQKAAEAEQEQVSELYRAQEATSLDADQAESSAADARRAVVTGRLALRLAQIKAWHAAGSLEDAALKEVLP